MLRIPALICVLVVAACADGTTNTPAEAPLAVGGPTWGHVEVVTALDGRVAQVISRPEGTELRVDGVVVVEGDGRPGRPVFSPDGLSLAYVSGETGVASVWILHLASGARTQLTNVGIEGKGLPANFVPPPVRAGATLWTDSGQLIWDAGDSVWACAADGGGCRRLLATPATPTSSSPGAVTLRGPDGVGRRVLLGS